MENVLQERPTFVKGNIFNDYFDNCKCDNMENLTFNYLVVSYTL